MSNKKYQKKRTLFRTFFDVFFRKKTRSLDDAHALQSFSIEQVKAVDENPSQPSLTPDEQALTRIYKTFATTVWRMHNLIISPETNEPKEELNERGIARIARYLESLKGALDDANVQIKGDYAGHPYDEGDAVKVIAFEDRNDLSRDEYIETLIPTVRWVNKDGKLRLLQQAEVVVGKTSAAKN